MKSTRLYKLVVATALCANAVAFAEEVKPVPCSSDPQFNQQDFALGEWDVYADGKQTATVHLEKVLNSCGIQEKWTPVSKSEGHGLGMFTYSRLLKSWGYFWVADTGQTTAFTGQSRASGEMLYETTAPLPGGGSKKRHWTLKLQPDGTVQELSVGSTDGKAWTKEYELIWHKRK